MCTYSFFYIIDELMPFYGLISLFRVTGFKEAQGARQRNARRNWHQKRRFRVRGGCSGTVASTEARKYEENTKSGISCGQPYGCIAACNTVADTAAVTVANSL